MDTEQTVKDAQIARRDTEANVYTRAEQKRRKEARRQHRLRAAESGGVYFIEAVGLKKVKIGYAANAKRRLAELTTGCPVPLRLAAFVKGPRSLEFDMHMKFFNTHSHGEWFNLGRRMAAFIGQNAPTPETP